MFLLDTNIISALRLRSEKVEPAWQWAQSHPQTSMFLSVLTLFEIEKGILAMARKDPAFADRLQLWLEQVIQVQFQGRELALSQAIASSSAKCASAQTKDSVDMLIAGTALHHNLTLVTRNTKDFQHITGLKLVNPWEAR